MEWRLGADEGSGQFIWACGVRDGRRGFQGQVERHIISGHLERFQPGGQQFLDGKQPLSKCLVRESHADSGESFMNTILIRILPSTTSSRSFP